MRAKLTEQMVLTMKKLLKEICDSFAKKHSPDLAFNEYLDKNPWKPAARIYDL